MEAESQDPEERVLIEKLKGKLKALRTKKKTQAEQAGEQQPGGEWQEFRMDFERLLGAPEEEKQPKDESPPEESLAPLEL